MGEASPSLNSKKWREVQRADKEPCGNRAGESVWVVPPERSLLRVQELVQAVGGGKATGV